jgi:hypothetical protein
MIANSHLASPLFRLRPVADAGAPWLSVRYGAAYANALDRGTDLCALFTTRTRACLQFERQVGQFHMKCVIWPDGRPLTMADLPGPKSTRWVIRRKARVVAAVCGAVA